jgi:hypothetical protein
LTIIPLISLSVEKFNKLKNYLLIYFDYKINWNHFFYQ